jgi:hypothetical protein
VEEASFNTCRLSISLGLISLNAPSSKIKTNNREEIVKDVEEKDGYEVKEISVVL